jgi:hypothetical protein
VIDPPTPEGERPEYGPFKIENGLTRVMRSSSRGFRPDRGAARSSVGDVRDLSHAHYQGAGSGRQSDR